MTGPRVAELVAAAADHYDVARRDVHLVARPAGVIHAYVGPLTPSGRYIPRAGRTACRAHTRRLGVLERTTLPLDPQARRVCARCSARLFGRGSREPSRAASLTREEALATYGHLTAFDLAVDVYMAQTVAEIERVEWLALLVVGFPACRRQSVVSPTGKTSAPLDRWIFRARVRLGAVHRDERLEAKIAADREHAALITKENKRAARAERYGDLLPHLRDDPADHQDDPTTRAGIDAAPRAVPA